MSNRCALSVRHWAAICPGPEGEDRLGDAAGEDIVPAGVRRRMGKLERLAVRAMLSVLQSGTTSELIFCSRFGNLETLASLLRSIGVGEPVSPMGFSSSVHNAAPGMVGQIRKEKIAHTALAAGEATLQAGLVEAYARLKADRCQDVILAFADLPFSDVYSELAEEDGAAIGLAMRLVLAENVPSYTVEGGRAGALALVGKLREGVTTVAVGGEPWSTLG